MNPDDFGRFCCQPLLKGLSPIELTHLSHTARSRGVVARTQILEAGEVSSAVHLILSGEVKLLARSHAAAVDGATSKTNRAAIDGDEILVSMLGVGDFVGSISILSEGRQPVSARTVSDARFAVFRTEQFLAALQKYPVISHNLNVQLAQKVQQLIAHSVSFSTLGVPGRLAFQLLRFARVHGQKLPDGTILISLRITQNDLAHLCGASREQINRILKSWKQQNWVSMKDDNFLILQSQLLEKLAR